MTDARDRRELVSQRTDDRSLLWQTVTSVSYSVSTRATLPFLQCATVNSVRYSASYNVEFWRATVPVGCCEFLLATVPAL
jgi:hypothetical protein